MKSVSNIKVQMRCSNVISNMQSHVCLPETHICYQIPCFPLEHDVEALVTLAEYLCGNKPYKALFLSFKKRNCSLCGLMSWK